ncbi:MAG: hypothetical protein HZB62_14390 [Nitrospirae bacterium]|nr:hypothetical protein [Nitrospirota bacterium]
MDIEIIRRISLARHLYELGLSSLRSKNDLYLFSAVNLFQDSVEAFLIAVAEHVNAAIDQNTKFDKYFVAINDKIAPKELPFRVKLLRLNRLRVDSKHYGIQPERDECERLTVAVHEFFDEVSLELLGASFSTICAIDLLKDGATKTLLLEAKADLEKNEMENCAINCRKAIFLAIEKDYSISEYKDGKPMGLLAGFTYAPYYTQNKEYIDKNVKEPTDYIVYDHSRINQELLTNGVDTTAFWNVWRLTPEVFKTTDGKWIVKHDFAKLDRDLLADKLEYIFSATLDIILAIHKTREGIRTSGYGRYQLTLRQDNVSVFEKADRNSKIIGAIPPGMQKIETDYRVEGFEDDGPYWHVTHYEKDVFLYGFIHNDDVE